jgi:hypothetical protein
VDVIQLDLQRATVLDELQEWIGGLSSDGTHIGAVAELGRPENVLSLLERILDDDDVLAEIAVRSYRHVNHFDKIVLVDSERDADYRLTLHLWNPPYTEQELNEELIHDHRFSFWSTVLTGTLRSESFSRRGGGRRYRQYQYVPERRTSTNFYEFVGEATLRSSGITEKPAGSAYYLAYETIHRVQLPLEDMTCTLVLRGPRERRHSNVFNTAYPDTDVSTVNTPFSPGELATKLTLLAGAVASRLP